MSKPDFDPIAVRHMRKKKRVDVQPVKKQRPRFTVLRKAKDRPTPTSADRERAAQASLQSEYQDVIEYTGAEDHPEIAAQYGALMGVDRPLSKTPASDGWAHGLAVQRIIEEMSAQLSANPAEVGLRVARFGVVPGSKAVIPIPQIKDASRVYGRAGLEAVSAIRICTVPGADPTNPDLALDLVTISWGEAVSRNLFAATRRSRKPTPFVGSKMKVFEPGDMGWVDGFRALLASSVDAPPDPDLPIDGKFDHRCPYGRRALTTLMARSQLPLRRAFVHSGLLGKGILQRAFSKVEGDNNVRCKVGPDLVHQDGIPHFWFDELRRQQLDNISVPIVRHH